MKTQTASTHMQRLARFGFQLITFGLLVGTLLLSTMPTHAALIGYWNFDEGTGTTANDTSGVSTPHTGTLAVGGTGALPTWIPGRFGNALDFNRVDNNNGSRVTVPNQPDLLLNDAFTVSFWYRPGPNVGTFPGPMRIGSQSATTGTTIGWGFFRNMSGTTPPRTMVYKRGNAQPGGWPTAMVNGQWYHVVIRHDGVNANLCIMSGVSTQSITQAWLDGTSTGIFEFGRMDQHDDCDLDDIAFFNEALPTERIATIYSVPTSLGLDYNLGDVRSLWTIFDGGPGSSAVVKGLTWNYTATLPGTHVAGEAFIVGADLYVAMTATTGVKATITTISGTYSPGGIGTAATVDFTPSPFTFNVANLVFDLNSSTTPGGGTNDLINVTTDMNVTSSTISINPLAPLANDTYRLINYGGVKTGSFSATVGNSTRYSITLDESTSGQVNAIVTGANADVKWTSATNGNWDLTTTNWQNTGSSTPDRFYQADSVRFDDSGAYGTNINLTTALYPASVTVDSSTLNYTFNGGTIGGAANGLTKNGSGSLTINSVGTYSGPVTINGGLLKMGTATALGTAAGGTTIAPGATLDLGGLSPGPNGPEAVTVGGAGLNSTGAVINTGAALSNNGLRGGVSLTGDTTFGGISRWDVFGGTFNGGGYKLTKTGPPEIALSNLGDTGLGDIDVLQGQLTILGNTQMGDNTKTVNVFPGTTLAHWASGATVHNKPLAMTSARLLNATSGNTDVATNLGAVSLTGTNTADGGSSIALLGDISGTGALTKNGSGTLYLGGANSYSGPTTINAGTLALAGTGTIPSSSIFVGSGATLNAATRTDGTLTIASGQTLFGNGTVRGNVAAGTGAGIAPGTSAGTLTITNELSLSEGATLTYELNSSTNAGGGINDLINVGGGLTLSGTTTLKIVPIGTIVVGQPYTLINYTGALTSGGDNFSVVTDSRLTYAVDATGTPGQVVVTASGGAETLEWDGSDAGGPLWDVKTTPNWVSTIVGDIFYAGDTVLFDDLGALFDVTLVGNLYPGNTRIEADANDYTFTGSGRIRAGGINKSLSGKLTIANSGLNDYPAPTVISGGTLQVGNGGTAGNLGPNIISNNATLTINRSDDLTFGNVMVGSGTLRKEGGNTLILPNLLSNFSGSIVVNGGIIRPTATNGVGNLIGGTTINPGATLDLNALNLDLEAVTVSGDGAGGIGALVNNSTTAQQNAFRNVTLAGNATFGGVGRWDIRNPGAGATLTGGGFALSKVGLNQVSLVNLGETDLGDINVLAGTLSVEIASTLGRAANTATVYTNATLMWWGGTVVHNKQIALNGGRLFKDNGNSTNLGPMSLSVTGIVEAANNSGTELTLKGIVSGTGVLVKNGAGNVNLTADNTYSGPTVINAGVLQLGEGGDTGSILGDIMVTSTLSVRRSNTFSLTNNITGPGGMFIRTTNGVVLEGPGQINIGGGIEVGRDIYGKLIVRDGANPVMGRMLLGNIANTPGEVFQQGGNVFVTLDARVGHWPTETSTYLLGGGTFNITNVPTGVVNPTGTPEQNGILYIGVDGTGIFTQTGGVATAHGIVLDARGNTAGTDTFALEGGTFNIGPSGIKSGSLDANASYQIYLGGGTLFSSANWTSTLAMTLTGTNGDVTIDTAANSVTLNGVLSGTGGMQKTGGGTLRLNRANTFAGTLAINQGTLSGTGAISGPLIIGANATFAPGLSIGTFTATGPVTLGGTTLMEINKTGATRTSDLLTGVSTLTYGGTLTIVASGDALASGDTFNLFDAATFTGSFGTINLPPVAAGSFWDTSKLGVDGTIRVVSRPEIGTPVLSAGILTLSGTNGVPNAPFSVRSSVDVAAPLASWTEVATGAFDGSGNFSVNFPVGDDLQRFYVIVVP